MEDKKKLPVCLTPISQAPIKRKVRSVSRTPHVKPKTPGLFKFRSYLEAPKLDEPGSKVSKASKVPRVPKVLKVPKISKFSKVPHPLGASPFLNQVAASSQSLATVYERHQQVLHGLVGLSQVLAEAQHPHAATLQQISQFYQETLALSAYAEVSPGLTTSLAVQGQLLKRLAALASPQP